MNDHLAETSHDSSTEPVALKRSSLGGVRIHKVDSRPISKLPETSLILPDDGENIMDMDALYRVCDLRTSHSPLIRLEKYLIMTRSSMPASLPSTDAPESIRASRGAADLA